MKEVVKTVKEEVETVKEEETVKVVAREGAEAGREGGDHPRLHQGERDQEKGGGDLVVECITIDYTSNNRSFKSTN